VSLNPVATLDFGTELFVDDALIMSKHGVTRTLHAGIKHEGVTLSLSLAFWIGSAARLPLLGPEYGTFRFGRKMQKVSKVEESSNPEKNG